jgi:hypothetical protein
MPGRRHDQVEAPKLMAHPLCRVRRPSEPMANHIGDFILIIIPFSIFHFVPKCSSYGDICIYLTFNCNCCNELLFGTWPVRASPNQLEHAICSTGVRIDPNCKRFARGRSRLAYANCRADADLWMLECLSYPRRRSVQRA